MTGLSRSASPGRRRRTQDQDSPSNGFPRPDEATAQDVLWQQLVAQFRWYDQAAGRARVAYLTLKVVALVLSAVVTVLAAVGAFRALTAGLAAGVVVLEGVQQVFQLHPNWISYRSSAETLRQHAVLFVAAVAPYDDPGTRRNRVADLLSSVTAAETASWSSTMRQAAGTPTGSGP